MATPRSPERSEGAERKRVGVGPHARSIKEDARYEPRQYCVQHRLMPELALLKAEFPRVRHL